MDWILFDDRYVVCMANSTTNSTWRRGLYIDDCEDKGCYAGDVEIAQKIIDFFSENFKKVFSTFKI